MTLFALLTKEMRLRMRSERIAWVLVAYVVMMGLLGWLATSSYTTYGNTSGQWASTGTLLYSLLTNVQLFLIAFVTPAFTATAINGEKERQTYDLLICSRLTSLELVSGKLIAGLSSALLLIAASIPLFSLVFFFGGVSLVQALLALLIFTISAITIAAFGLLCSTFFRRPAISTAVTYMATLFWLVVPIALTPLLQQTSAINSVGVTTSSPGAIKNAGAYVATAPQLPLHLIWNPLYALSTATPSNNAGYYALGALHLTPWLAYTLLDILAIIVFFLLSIWYVKPYALYRLQNRTNSGQRRTTAQSETGATAAM